MSREFNASPKTTRHAHAREYFGEKEAGLLIEWLNILPDGDWQRSLVEEFIDATNARKPSLDRAKKAYDNILNIIIPEGRPVLGFRQTTDWNLVPEIYHGRLTWIEHKTEQPWLHAGFDNLLQLAILNLLSRVRRCALLSCRRWFFARFKHSRFHSVKCQQQAIRSDPEWKKKHAADMRKARRRERIREQALKGERA